MALPLPKRSSLLKSLSGLTSHAIFGGQLTDDLIELVADVSLPLLGNHIRKRATFRNDNRAMPLASIFVGNILNEEQRQDVVFVLGCIHTAAQLIATCPKRGIQISLLNCHLVLACSRYFVLWWCLVRIRDGQRW